MLLAPRDALVRLREENELLRERVRQLEDLLRPDESTVRDYVSTFDVTWSEATLLDLLMRRERVGRDQYQAAVCTEDMVGASLMSVRVHRLRDALKHTDIRISTSWGQGYFLTAADKDRVRFLHNEWIGRGRPENPDRYQKMMHKRVVRDHV